MPMNPAVQAVIKAITRLQPDVANSWNSQRKVEDAAGKLTGPSSWDGYVACVAGDALNASRGTSQFLKVETMEKPELYK